MRMASWMLAFTAILTTHIAARGQAGTPAAPREASVEAVFLASIGGGPENGRFKHPFGIAVAPTGKVYVADSGYCRIQVFDGNGAFLFTWGTPGDGPAQFRNPNAIAFDVAGNAYVADTWNHRVQVFTGDGEFMRMWGSKGAYDGQFNAPLGIAVDAAGDVYVADTFNYRIQVFTNEGTFLRKWGSKGKGPGQFLHPKFPGGDGDGPVGITVAANGEVYVTDPWNFRVQVFTRDGTYLREWGRLANPGGSWNTPAAIELGLRGGYLNTPRGIAVDHAGDVLVVNRGGMSTFGGFNVQKFTADGEFLQRWGKDGTGPGQFASPTGVAVDAAGNFYVVDTDNNRVQKFSRAGAFVHQWPPTGHGFLRDPSGITLDAAGNLYVVDTGNKRVQKFSPAGEFVGKWGTPGSGPPAPGRFYHPGKAAMDSRGRIFVTDLMTPTQIFDTSGTYISTWTPNETTRNEFGPNILIDRSDHLYVASLKRIWKVTMEGKRLTSWRASPVDIALDTDGNLYVTEAGDDEGDSRIRVLAPSGRELARWRATRGPSGRWGQYLGITVTPMNQVIALDWRNCRVEVFTRTGQLLGRWGSCGFGAGRFDDLSDVVADAQGRVYVSDHTNNCVQVFQLREKREP